MKVDRRLAAVSTEVVDAPTGRRTAAEGLAEPAALTSGLPPDLASTPAPASTPLVLALARRPAGLQAHPAATLPRLVVALARKPRGPGGSGP